MNINGIGGIKVNGSYGAKVQRTKKTAEKSAPTDNIGMSDFARDLDFAAKAVRNVPDVRQARIDELKRSGSYMNTDAKTIAEKMAKDFFA